MKKPEESNNENNGNSKKIDITFKVINAKLWPNRSVSFAMELNGVTIYGCRVVEGQKGDFISFPSRKGSDGKYYNHVWIPLTKEQQSEILAEVERKINE